MTAEIRSDLKACMRHRRQVPWEFLCTRYHCKVNSSCLIPPFFCDLSPLAYISPVSAARWWCSERVTPGAGQAPDRLLQHPATADELRARRSQPESRAASGTARRTHADVGGQRPSRAPSLTASLALLGCSCRGPAGSTRPPTFHCVTVRPRSATTSRTSRLQTSNSTMWTVRNSHVRLQDPLGGGSYRPASFVHDPSLHAGLSKLRQIS